MEDMRAAVDGLTEVTDQYHREIEYPPAEEHLWALFGVFRIQPSDIDRMGKVNLGSSNLLSIEGPSCFVCGQPWSEGAAAAACPGEPSDTSD